MDLLDINKDFKIYQVDLLHHHLGMSHKTLRTLGYLKVLAKDFNKHLNTFFKYRIDSYNKYFLTYNPTFQHHQNRNNCWHINFMLTQTHHLNRIFIHRQSYEHAEAIYSMLVALKDYISVISKDVLVHMLPIYNRKMKSGLNKEDGIW